MTIKKQFVILSSIIVAIPLICSLFVLLYSNFNSSKRYFLSGPQELDQIPSPSDAERFKKSIRQIPPDIQLLICSPDQNKIFYSTIPEISVKEKYNHDEVWNLIRKTSDKYFYQFSSPPIKDIHILIITRIPRRNSLDKNQELYSTIFLILIITAVISLILIILISKTIFNSITQIENKTQQLADGNISEKIETDSIEKGNEITSILQSLEKMRTELIETQERKNRFIMGISHDLRTPVAVIKGYSEAIYDGVITEKEEIKTTISLIDTKATQLDEMIDTLINFMKLNNTETKETLKPQSITDIIFDFAKYAEITGTVFKRKIVTDINLPEKISVPLNLQLIHRSFENIFSNAIRYTDDNDTISIISYIEQKAKNRSIILKIQDTGIGIDKKDINSIFDMFFRGTNSRLEEGMGIGLSVVKTIMDTHGWNISVESEKNVGTCFIIEVPVKKN